MDRPKKIAFAVGSLLLFVDLWLNLPAERHSHRLDLISSTHVSSYAPRPTPARSTEKVPSVPNVEPENKLCKISKRTDIPLGGDLRVQSYERTEGGTMYWIKSSDCPAELYSIVWIDREGRIDKEISCLRTTLTELTLNSGLQANIEIVPVEKNSRPLAISGNGRFLVNCPDTGLTLTRDGRFHLKSDALENTEGCIAWTLKDGGRKVVLADEDTLDDRGCSETTRECLDLYEPDERDAEAFNFKTSKSLMVLNQRGLKKSHSGILFQSALEDLDTADRSLTGVENWETMSVTQLPAHCP